MNLSDEIEEHSEKKTEFDEYVKKWGKQLNKEIKGNDEINQSVYVERKPKAKEQPIDPMNATDGLALKEKTRKEIPVHPETTDPFKIATPGTSPGSKAIILTSKLNRKKIN